MSWQRTNPPPDEAEGSASNPGDAQTGPTALCYTCERYDRKLWIVEPVTLAAYPPV